MHHPEGKTDREQKYLIADRKYIDIIRFFHGRSGWTWIPVSPNCSRILPNTALGFPALTNTVFFWTNYRNVPWNRLESHHCVNHLRDSICFSQKDCFLEALQQHDKNVKETIYIDEFLPRSFVLCAAQDFQSSMEIFMCHFMYFAALAAIKHLSTGKFEDSKWTLFPSEEQISASIHLLTIIRCHMRSNMRQFIARELQNAFDLYDPCWKCLQHPLCSTWRPSINVMKYNEMNYLMKFFEANDNQYHLVQTSNVWICKPARSSQGRGIKLFTSLDTLNEHLRHELRSSPSKQSRNWIVQKYIESPVELRNSCSRVAGSLPHPSINRRKFDLRQWVLITSLRPLKVYWYRHCYARFSSKEYTLRNIDDRFVHLCNYSVQKANVTSSMARNPQESACIRHSKEIQQRLRQKYEVDVWSQVILPQMKAATKSAMEAVLPRLQAIGKGFEWLGLDFLVDSELHVWLLEANISPDLSYGDDIRRDLVPRAVRDTLHLIIREEFKEEDTDRNGWIPLSI